MSIMARILVGGGLCVLGGLVAGPAGAYAGWKGGGFLATGNVLHLIPGAGGAADGMDLAAGLSDFADMSDLSDGAGPDIHNNQGNLNVHQSPPLDGHGNEQGRLGNGNMPSDIWQRKA